MPSNTSKNVTENLVASQDSKKPSFSDLSLRIMVAVPAIILSAICLIYFPKFFKVLISAIAFMCLFEWALLIKGNKSEKMPTQLFLMGAGVHYIVVGIYGIYTLYCDRPNLCLIALLILVWSCDVGAYIAGRMIGGPKLMPRVSPNKTWSGAVGGATLAFILTKIFYYYFPSASLSLLSDNAFILLMIITSQSGDLLESAIKRYFKVKDSSTMIPGHGGFLDRFDSLIAVGYMLVILKIIQGF